MQCAGTLAPGLALLLGMAIAAGGYHTGGQEKPDVTGTDRGHACGSAARLSSDAAACTGGPTPDGPGVVLDTASG